MPTLDERIRATPAEMAELERRYDGAIPPHALDDLRHQLALPAEVERSRGRAVLEAAEMNLRTATRDLREAVEREANEAAIGNHRRLVDEWMDRVQDARAQLHEIEAGMLLGRVAE